MVKIANIRIFFAIFLFLFHSYFPIKKDYTKLIGYNFQNFYKIKIVSILQKNILKESNYMTFEDFNLKRELINAIGLYWDLREA